MARLAGHPWRIGFVGLAAAIAAFVIVNLFDQALTPEAGALFARPGAPFSRDSGWALMLGFNAPVGQDPRDYGEALRKIAANKRGLQRGPDPELEVRAANELVCSPESMDCVRAFTQRPESIADLAASDNAVLLARYDELLRSTRLRDGSEALDFYGSSGYFQAIMRTQGVRLSQVGAAAGSGKLDAALALLEADAAFYRRWLDDAGSILSKMLAVRGLARDLLLAGQVARSGTVSSPAQWETLERIAAPLTLTQRGVGPVLRAEAWFFAQVLDLLVAQPRWTSEVIDSPPLGALVVSKTVKRNATLNFAQPLFADWIAVDAVPGDEIDAAVEQTRARIRRAGERDWTWAYNYMGKAFTAESPPDLGEYVYRVRDLDALAAIARCTIALRRAQVASDAAGSFVSSSPACRDPYGGALAWDAGARDLSFKPRSPGQVKRFGGSGERVRFAAYGP